MLAEEEGVDGGSVNGGGESSEEELAVLPRHTKVVVTGNNRTKSVLVGLQGVVKKAVGLGGWHWLVRFSLLRIQSNCVQSNWCNGDCLPKMLYFVLFGLICIDLL